MAGAIGGTLVFRTSNEFLPGTPGAVVTISVREGESGTQIALELEKNGVIRSQKSFYSLALRDSRALSISPGEHRIQSHITSKQALEQLLDPARNGGVVRVVEGSTLSDIYSLLKKSGLTGSIPQLPPLDGFSGAHSLEGFLFPATYSLSRGVSVPQAIESMRMKFSEAVKGSGLLSGSHQYSPYDLLKIASLIQIEADSADLGKAAQVIYNRLKIGMPLQLNSTVQYALNLRGHIALSKNATKVSSPFNTYIHTGLPPTPISNPGIAAINAALHSVSGPWLYFITVKPHDTRFTDSFSEFQGWVTLYNNNLANGAFK